jgi:hypothetical protein
MTIRGLQESPIHLLFPAIALGLLIRELLISSPSTAAPALLALSHRPCLLVPLMTCTALILLKDELLVWWYVLLLLSSPFVLLCLDVFNC